jgi:hypothetical protein
MTDAIRTSYYRDILGDAYRVEIFADYDAESPRESTDCNLSEFNTLTPYRNRFNEGSLSRYLPDEYFVWDGRTGELDARRVAKWVALFCPDILAYSFLDASDRLMTTSVDGYVNGMAIVTHERFAEMMGSDRLDDDARATAQDAIEDEVELYRSWQDGDYVGVIVSAREDGEWVEYESCWGYENERVATEFANDVIGTLDNETTDEDIETMEADDAQRAEADAQAELAAARY